MFVAGVRAVANCAETIESWDAEPGGEVAIRGAARGAFAERDAHLRSEFFCPSEKFGTGFALEWSAAEAPGDFDFCTLEHRLERSQLSFDGLHVGNAKRAQIENGACLLRNDVYAGAAVDDVCVDGDAAADIVPFKDLRDLQS